jgi:hypothetical protein
VVFIQLLIQFWIKQRSKWLEKWINFGCITESNLRFHFMMMSYWQRCHQHVRWGWGHNMVPRVIWSS